MDLTRPPATDAGGSPARRFHARHILAIGLGAWLVVGIIPLAWRLPPAFRVGTANRRLHGQFSALESGWTGSIEHSPNPASKDPTSWEWSYGPISTIGIAPGWTALSLRLAPMHCPDGQPQRVFIHGPGGTGVRTLVLAAGYHWYRIGVGPARAGRTLTFTYHCVVVPASLNHGNGDVRPLAVEVAGLVGTT